MRENRIFQTAFLRMRENTDYNSQINQLVSLEEQIICWLGDDGHVFQAYEELSNGLEALFMRYVYQQGLEDAVLQPVLQQAHKNIRFCTEK